MKKIIAFAVALLTISIAVNSQSLKYQSGIGYEMNIFKNPGSLLQNGELQERADMYQNGVFSYHAVNFGSKFRKGRFYVTPKVKGSTYAYLNRLDATSARFAVELPVRFRLKKGQYMHFKPLYSTFKQQGTDLSSGAIRTPLAFATLKLPLLFEKKMGDRGYSVGAFYQYKNYPTADENELFYHAFGTTLEHQRKMGKSLRSTLALEAFYRQYTDVNFKGVITDEEVWDEEFDDENFDELTRRWGYLKAKYSLRKKTKTGFFEVPLTSSMRLDMSTNKYGYWQHDAAFRYKIAADNRKLFVKARLGHRYFFSLKNEDDMPIQYVYVGGDLKYEAPLSKKLSFFTNVGVIKRFSTKNKETSIALREYFNARVNVGLTYRFFQ